MIKPNVMTTLMRLQNSLQEIEIGVKILEMIIMLPGLRMLHPLQIALILNIRLRQEEKSNKSYKLLKRCKYMMSYIVVFKLSIIFLKHKNHYNIWLEQ